MKQLRWFSRAIAVMVCTALLLGACSLSLFAEDIAAPDTEMLRSDAQADAFAEEDPALLARDLIAPLAQGEEEEEEEEEEKLNFFEKFFRIFNFFGFTIQPTEGYVYNQQIAPNWLFGHNGVYDAVPFFAGVFADSLTSKFVYEGKEWKLKFWKGSYATCFATGGEIGVYNRNEGASLGSHYFAATKEDWLDMSMTIYQNNAKLFTRPTEKQWWCTGYFPNVTGDMFYNPRTMVVMDASVTLKSPEMAELFIADLLAKDFSEYVREAESDPPMGLSTPETYSVSDDGMTVRLIWQTYTDNWH